MDYSKKIYKDLRFLPEGVRLKPIDDSGEIFVPSSCKVEQLANMQGLKVFVVGDFWNKMDNVNKAALALHEFLWVSQRMAGRKFSKRARRDVARYFATNYNFTQIAPSLAESHLTCSSSNLDHQINKITVATRFILIETPTGYKLEYKRIGGLLIHNNFYTNENYLNDIFDGLGKDIYTEAEYQDYYPGNLEVSFDIIQEDQDLSFMVTMEVKFTKLEKWYLQERKFPKSY